jgi:hypothetical protein
MARITQTISRHLFQPGGETGLDEAVCDDLRSGVGLAEIGLCFSSRDNRDDSAEAALLNNADPSMRAVLARGMPMSAPGKNAWTGEVSKRFRGFRAKSRPANCGFAADPNAKCKQPRIPVPFGPRITGMWFNPPLSQ